MDFIPNFHSRGGTEAPNFMGDAHAIPLKSDAFNGILLTEILEHIQDPKKVLQEAFRVVRSDGLVMVSIPFMFYEHQDPVDYRRFTPLGLESCLNQTGQEFETLKVKKMGGPGTVMMQTLQKLTYWKLQSNPLGVLFHYSIGLILLPIFSLLLNLAGIALDAIYGSEVSYSGIFMVFKKLKQAF